MHFLLYKSKFVNGKKFNANEFPKIFQKIIRKYLHNRTRQGKSYRFPCFTIYLLKKKKKKKLFSKKKILKKQNKINRERKKMFYFI